MRHAWSPCHRRGLRCLRCGLRRKTVLRPSRNSAFAYVRVRMFRWPGGKWEESKKVKPCFGGRRGDAK